MERPARGGASVVKRKLVDPLCFTPFLIDGSLSFATYIQKPISHRVICNYKECQKEIIAKFWHFHRKEAMSSLEIISKDNQKIIIRELISLCAKTFF